MKLAVLFSGGKDSCLAMEKTMEKEDVVCLISVISDNPESYMFHTPNINLAPAQAEAIGLPIILVGTEGQKEKELEDLRNGIEKAVEIFGIEGIVTGALASNYQKSRIEKICNELCIECFNPLWGMDQMDVLKQLFERNYEVVVIGVFAIPFGEEWLGKKIDKDSIHKLEYFEKKYKINPAGEGGEIETFVTDAPFFRKRIVIEKSVPVFSRDSGILRIEKIKLEQKKVQ